MHKVSKEFFPKFDEQRDKELRQQLIAKQLEFLKADSGPDKDLADRLKKEKEHLITELRMINPKIGLTETEESLQNYSDFKTKMQHNSLNEKSKPDYDS